MWTKGQAWRVVNGLNQLNAQIRAKYPQAVPPATDINSWGAIADDAHSASSDHYPHYYSALGSTAVVCARDFPHAPNLGMDGGTITEHMRQQRDHRVQYIIFNRRITGVNYGWSWHTYTGDDPHDTHFHISSVHTAVADGTEAWSLPGSSVAASEETFMYAGTYYSCSDSPNNPRFFGIPGMLCTWITGTGTPPSPADVSISALEDGQWIDPVAPAHGDGAAPAVHRSLIHIVGAIPPGFEDCAAFPQADVNVTLDPAQLAVIVGPAVLQVLQSTDGQVAIANAASQGVKNL